MPNEKVSQLIEIAATELAPTDLIFVGDVSSHESKKLQVSSLLTFVNISASINASHSYFADTASFIAGGNVVGTVATAAFATNATSASHALTSDTSFTSSYALSSPPVGTVDTASYLQYSGFNNGTITTAHTASFVQNSRTASFLQHINGQNNGTASFAISASWAPSAVAVTAVNSSSWASSSFSSSNSTMANTASYSYTSSIALTASFALNSVSNTKAWAEVTWSTTNAAAPELYNNYNVSQIKYLRTVDPGGNGGASGYHDIFAVSFTSPLSSADFIFLGNSYTCLGGMQYLYGIGIGSTTNMYPQETRSIYGFTMSISTGNASDRNYFWGGGTFTAFQVIG